MINWIKSIFVDDTKSEVEDLKNQCDLVLDKIENRTMTLQIVLDGLYESESSENLKEKENEESV